MSNCCLKQGAKIGIANGDFERYYYRDLLRDLKNDFKNYAVTRKTIPFFQLYSWFSWKKIDKEQAKQTISEMAKRDLVELVVFHGVRIK